MKIKKVHSLQEALEAAASGLSPNLEDVESLKWISIREKKLVIGSMADWDRIAQSPLVSKYAPLLASAASRRISDGAGGETLSRAVLEAGGDCAGLCLLLDMKAGAEVICAGGTRRLSLADLAAEPERFSAARGEILTALIFNMAPDGGSAESGLWGLPAGSEKAREVQLGDHDGDKH